MRIALTTLTYFEIEGLWSILKEESIPQSAILVGSFLTFDEFRRMYMESFPKSPVKSPTQENHQTEKIVESIFNEYCEPRSMFTPASLFKMILPRSSESLDYLSKRVEKSK